MAELLGVPVVVENDTNLAAVAEHRFGAAADSDNFVLLRFDREPERRSGAGRPVGPRCPRRGR